MLPSLRTFVKWKLSQKSSHLDEGQLKRDDQVDRPKPLTAKESVRLLSPRDYAASFFIAEFINRPQQGSEEVREVLLRLD